MIAEKQIKIIGLIENKIRSNNIEKIVKSCTPGWAPMHNAKNDGVCRILLCWDGSIVKIKGINVHNQCITCFAELIETGAGFFMSIIYGSNKEEERKSLWNVLSRKQK